jgi:diaminopropionate ammonia-lyase
LSPFAPRKAVSLDENDVQSEPSEISAFSTIRNLPSYAPTPLVSLPKLATACGMASVLVKDESRRLLGSFKSLGGMYAGLRALDRAAKSQGIAPQLLCASDGNHGLAVAAAAEFAGTKARVYLHERVPAARASRIAARGAEIVWVNGTYDDAVAEAAQAAARGEGLLIADTSADEHDPVVADVMAGYGLLAQEILDELRARPAERPTHVFVQAGVGGLAAAMAQRLCGPAAFGCRIVVVEPENAACVGLALTLGRIERLPGDLETSAEMLSCGEASAPAVKILLRHGAAAIAVSEGGLANAVTALAECGGPATTPSGATGLAGLLAAPPGSPQARVLGLNAASRVLLVVTEGPVPAA